MEQSQIKWLIGISIPGGQVANITMAECEFPDGVNYDSRQWSQTVDDWMTKLDISLLHVFGSKPDLERLAIEFEMALMGTGPLITELHQGTIEYMAYRPVVTWGPVGDA